MKKPKERRPIDRHDDDDDDVSKNSSERIGSEEAGGCIETTQCEHGIKRMGDILRMYMYTMTRK